MHSGSVTTDRARPTMHRERVTIGGAAVTTPREGVTLH